MAGKTGYTPTGPAMQGRAQIDDVYEHFDPLVGEARANAAALPATGNWPGRAIMLQDTGRMVVWTGSAWRGNNGLPAPENRIGPSSQAIGATAFAVIPNLPTISITAPAAMLVRASLRGWAGLASGATGDLRGGVQVTGATSSPANDPAWGHTMFVSTVGVWGLEASKELVLDPGVSVFSGVAYHSGAGIKQINYSSLTVTPLRWA